MAIEAEVHSSLLSLLRLGKNQALGIATNWQHHLTMGRLVARALRLERSALIQTALKSDRLQVPYRLSYLTPALLWKSAVILVVTESIQEQILQVEIPYLQAWLKTDKEIVVGFPSTALSKTCFPNPDFSGLLLVSPQSWLAAQLEPLAQFPTGIPTLIDGADRLQTWIDEALTVAIHPKDWSTLMQQYPESGELIRDVRVALTKAVFSHPPNPYESYLVTEAEQAGLRHLIDSLGLGDISGSVWQKFALPTTQPVVWAKIERSLGLFSLFSIPVTIADRLAPIWNRQPVVLVGGAVELDPQAPIYRSQLGLGELTCLKFSRDRQTELIELYIPKRFPLPNTPQYQTALIQQISLLLKVCWQKDTLAVIIIGDSPLKTQVAAFLASEFGSQVQLEKVSPSWAGILVSGWKFWQQEQDRLPPPHLMIIATLPIPSVESPLVAGRVAHYKHQRQDWFRLYLLPAALRELQRAIAPVRERQGVVALLDSRVNYRSYGQDVLAALSPYNRINYPDRSWFT
ncbi:helicase C-terminal domain-containing protein [Merismopedia glauca]|uniref:Helicase n=1 Tax=Merismopedia glauca CCAP 1448/3 TaxID=1296344 RepID=A0A2T1C0H2_9CYAN|nr:helicase C-terminal domain-containing protein [Merismopedia glauca]PSB01668.1 helicase [Merismopedia glauca CCAP 1448/3]